MSRRLRTLTARMRPSPLSPTITRWRTSNRVIMYSVHAYAKPTAQNTPTNSTPTTALTPLAAVPRLNHLARHNPRAASAVPASGRHTVALRQRVKPVRPAKVMFPRGAAMVGRCSRALARAPHQPRQEPGEGRMLRTALAALAGLVLLLVPAASAADFPTRPVILVVAFPPGGASDVLARILGRKLEQILGQPFVIDNRPGAGGNVAAEAVARAAPDGYTLLEGNNAILATNAALYKKINFDPVADFAPIGLIGSQANILVVNPSVPVKSVAELIALAKANPGKLNFASSGHGLAAHLAGELFNADAKIDIVHVPYKGAAAVLPDIPTIDELGIKNFDATTWHGLVAPAHTPKDVIATLNRALAAALDDPDVKTSLAALGVDVIGGTPEEFAAYIKSEIPKWAAIIKASGAKLD